jgi:signal transduction histidine kinase
LYVNKGPDEGKHFDLGDKPLGIGRDAANPLRLHDTEVSRRHAEFQPIEGGFRIVDLGSANGTFVNKAQIKEAILRPGDQIQIGQTVLLYSSGRPSGQPVSDLADRISMISRTDLELSSAIIKTIGETEGSRILARPEQASSPWLKNALANLSVMYEASQAVSHILDVDQLLERIMELIFRSIQADRGCIMLRHPETNQFQPTAVRWREKVDREEKIAISRTIMEYVLNEKQGILVSDAARDQRFNTGQSILRFGIREVICVPMKGRHETVGVLYLDTHSSARELLAKNQTSRFTEEHLALAIALAHQAALAVEETRYHHAMVQAERLAAIGQTIAALSHHIKNILQGLQSGSEIIKYGLNDKDQATFEKGWRLVEKNQAKISDLVMDMLSYSKEREPSIEDTDINKVARDVVELMAGRAKKLDARLETRFDPELKLVPADPEGIHRALLNVIGNAIDAVEERENPQVIVATSIEPDQRWVRIAVLDNGVGIPANKLTDIFKPFVSSKGARGTGLGLAVSRKILREHGGDILVESKPGKGTLMTLRLPMKSPLSLDVSSTLDDRARAPMTPPPPPPEES